MRDRGRALVPTLTLALCLGVLAFPALAQTYPPGETSCGVSDTAVVPGQTVTVTGSGYPPNSEVTITLTGGIVLGTVTTDDTGSFTVDVVIPADVEPGQYSISCIDVSGETIGTDVTVVGAAVVGTAFTGSSLNVPLWTVLSAILLGTGLMLLVAGRRSRRRQHAGSRS